MAVIGETLRRERMKRNLELDEISRELKISSRFLEAIEDERFDKLPRGVFAKSFVRQYARLLGLDEDELAGEVQRATEPSGPQFAEHAAEPVLSEIKVPRVEAWQTVADSRMSRSSSLPALAMLVVVMLVCSGVYALWQRSRRPAAPQETAVPTQTAETPAPRPAQTPPQVQPAAPPETVARQSPPVQTPSPTQNGADRPGSVAPTAAAPSAINPTPPATQTPVPPSNPNAPVRVEVSATEQVWVGAKADGKSTFSGTLDANQTRTFDANENLTLRLGNAGGVTIKLNGQPIPAVGPKGQVRTVQFTSGGFQIVAPKPALDLDDFR